MDKLIKCAKRYNQIIAKYDGGNHYTWESAYEDLVDLYYKSSAVRDSIRSPENKLLADLLVSQITSEAHRIFLLTDLQHPLC